MVSYLLEKELLNYFNSIKGIGLKFFKGFRKEKLFFIALISNIKLKFNAIFRFLLNMCSALTLGYDNFGLEIAVPINLTESVEYIKIQELTFLPEYYFITILFCLTLFSLFSLKLGENKENFEIKFQYNNQLIFLLNFGLICYLILILQQKNMVSLSLVSFNDTIYNDHLSLMSKLIIGVSSILYLVFISKYLKSQKLSNFEYYIILFTSIFGFFLLCSANDLITAYLSIELQGLAFYVLAAFKKSSNFSVESGVKYFVLGSLSTAIFLLGTTFIYGLSGSILLTDFKDFFVWVFSINSFFLSFDSIFKALEAFQERFMFSDDSFVAKLQVTLDKLDLFQKKFYFLMSDSFIRVFPVENPLLFIRMICLFSHVSHAFKENSSNNFCLPVIEIPFLLLTPEEMDILSTRYGLEYSDALYEEPNGRPDLWNSASEFATPADKLAFLGGSLSEDEEFCLQGNTIVKWSQYVADSLNKDQDEVLYNIVKHKDLGFYDRFLKRRGFELVIDKALDPNIVMIEGCCDTRNLQEALEVIHNFQQF